MKNLRLKNKFLLFFGLVFLITALTSVYNLYIALSLRNRVEQLYKTEVLMRQVKMMMTDTKEVLDSFLLTQKQEYRDEVYESVNSLNRLLDGRRAIYHNREHLMVKDISFLVEKYGTQLEGIMEAKTYRDIVGYTGAYEAAELTSSYIDTYIDKVLLENLNRRAESYRSFSQSYQQLQLYSVVLVLSAIILTMSLILLFTDRFTNPIAQLANQAGEISQGNFEISDIPVTSEDEVGVTTQAFNEMKNSIHTYIEQLQEKRRVERNLAEERVKNLEMEHLLKNAEIVSLRTQMNPHFLFNTLNTGVQLAIMEEADRTADFMGDLAVLFRHNVRRMWQKNTLRDEVEGLEYYTKLLKVRFGETYRVYVDIPEEFMEAEFPPMILQPLLENSIIHGFSDTEGGGSIEVRGFQEGGRRIVSVKDDGVGMSARNAAEVLRPISYSEEDFSSQSGIGLRNVVLRLRLFFNNPEVVSIVSASGEGTEVRIRLGHRGDMEQRGESDV